MIAILSVLLGVTFAVLAAVARRSRHDAHRVCALEQRETHALAAVRDFVRASRSSSDEVIGALARSLRDIDPSVDAVLAFAPDDHDLQCFFADGERVQHFARARLRRDGCELPARAGAAGHRLCAAEDGMLVPTDRCALAVPLVDERGLRAVIYASSSRTCRFDAQESLVRTIEHACAPYAMALERERDRADATYDGLTGLLTPRAFRTKLQEELVRARFDPRGMLTLWFVDTDRFKSVNDTYGHAAGDVVLQRMADVLRAHVVPEIDCAARNGGDEFCAMIYGVQKTIALERAQEFCDAVRVHDFGVPMRITASIGIATYPFDAQTASELLEVADAAMYASKRAGRDRVSFSPDGSSFVGLRAGSYARHQ